MGGKGGGGGGKGGGGGGGGVVGLLLMLLNQSGAAFLSVAGGSVSKASVTRICRSRTHSNVDFSYIGVRLVFTARSFSSDGRIYCFSVPRECRGF